MTKGKLHIKVDEFTFTFKIDEEIEHKGVKSSSDLTSLFRERFQEFSTNTLDKLAKLKITVSNDSGKSITSSLDEMKSNVWPYVNNLMTYNVARLFKPVVLKVIRKDGGKTVWRPRWGSDAWSILNKVMLNNRKPIISLTDPTNVPDNAAFLPGTYHRRLGPLISEGYVKRVTTSDSDLIEARVNDRTWDPNTSNYTDALEVREFKGIWLVPTELGQEFHKKNTEKQFRMIHKLSGDPNLADDNARKDSYESWEE